MNENQPITLKEKVRQLPDKPGVYLMKDRLGRIIYVGKARSLKKRVSSYFQRGRALTIDQPKIRALIDLCRRKAPNATIIVTGILPRNDNIAVVPEISRINRNIASFADGRSIRYLDINDKLADSTGTLFDGVTVDGLHLSLKGYQIWADALKPVLTELLGPPAATDEAPPPTGDPSARRP